MIKKPTLLLDEKRCRRNIEKMVSKFRDMGIPLRPHFKTHQSIEIGEWFKEYGVDKITVSSLEMASYFSGSWDDITVAFPVNILEIDTINYLAKKIKLNLLIESVESATFLKEHVQHGVGVFVKIDVGYDRTGIPSGDIEQVRQILSVITSSSSLDFHGLLAHAGHTYQCRSHAEIIQVHEKSLESIISVKNQLSQEFPDCIISLGDTPSCSVAENFDGVDEVRPGNFVFYDLTQHQIGSNSIDEIAVALACPIVAIHKTKNKIIIYGGGVHFSKDQLIDPRLGTIYGKVVQFKNGKWQNLISNMYVSKLSQEHGTVHVPDSEIDNYKVGDQLIILPVHSCMTANLMRSYYNVNKESIVCR